MTIRYARLLFAATVNHQLRGMAFAALALTFLATGSSLKAQNCPQSYYTVSPSTTLPFDFHSCRPGV